MKTLLEVLQSGTEYLARQGCDEARATMQHLMAHVLHCNRTTLYSQFDRPVEEEELVPLRQLLKRKAAGEPLQHLLGTTEFFRREFLTDARALIPRPETEELVEMVLNRIPAHPVRILDMGTGSGIIGITLALELKDRAREVVLADISPKALDLALENAMREPGFPPFRRTCLKPCLPLRPTKNGSLRKNRSRIWKKPWNSSGPCRKPALMSLLPTCPISRTGNNLPRK